MSWWPLRLRKRKSESETQGGPALSLLYTSDLHGSEACFRKFLIEARRLGVAAAIIAGDVSAKTITPVRRLSANRYEAEVAGSSEEVEDGEALTKLLGRIRNSGSIPRIMSRAEASELRENDEIKKRLFLEDTRATLRRWLGMAQATLEGSGTRFLVCLGNDDFWELDDVLREDQFTEFLEGASGVEPILGVYEVLAESGGNPTPFHCPRDMSEEKLEARLRQKVAAGIRNWDTTIFVSHIPPKGVLDLAPALNPDLSPVVMGGSHLMSHIGSEAVLKIIREYQPLLALHGHAHEVAEREGRVGRTVCCNPGSEYELGLMHAILIDLSGPKVMETHLIIK